MYKTTGATEIAQTLIHRNFTNVIESQSHAAFTKMFRNYLTIQERAKFEQCDSIFFV